MSATATARKSSARRPAASPAVEAPAPTRSVRPARSARKTSAPAAPAPSAPAAPVSRRRSAPAKVEKTESVQSDALTLEAAPTTFTADGGLIRHTQEYTVDLLDEGIEPERDYSKVLAKSPSDVNLDFVAWVKEYVGVDIDPRTVQITISTYHEFQRTPAQKAKTIAKRLAAAQKRAEAEKNKAVRASKAAAAAKVAAK